MGFSFKDLDVFKYEPPDLTNLRLYMECADVCLCVDVGVKQWVDNLFAPGSENLYLRNVL